MPKHPVSSAPLATALRTPLAVLLAGCLLAGCGMMYSSASPPPQSDASSAEGAAPGDLSPQQRKMTVLADRADGPGGGWIIAAPARQLDTQRLGRMRRANLGAEQSPAGPGEVSKSDTADLNHDGFVTLDEIVAMIRAHLDDATITARLRATGYVFAMTDRQRSYLRQRGVSQGVLDAISALDGSSAARMAAAPPGP